MSYQPFQGLNNLFTAEQLQRLMNPTPPPPENVKIETNPGFITDPSQIKSEADVQSWLKYEQNRAITEAEKQIQSKLESARTDISNFYSVQTKAFNDAATYTATMGIERPAPGGLGTFRDPLYGVPQAGPRLPPKKDYTAVIAIAAAALYFLYRRKR